MARHLIVTQPFADFAVGDRIEDVAQVVAIQQSHPAFVVAVAAEAPKKSKAEKAD